MDLSFDDSSKRRRTTLASPNLVDLPLTSIADYLPSTNRILLAVALTASSLKDIGWTDAKLSTASKAVLASTECWGLDFAEISEYAGDPSDEDLRTLLLNIDAKNTLKTLNIGRCYKIVGHGLEPLRESTVLERLVLPTLMEKISLRDRPFLETTLPLSIEVVIPIVYSIINAICSSSKILDRLGLLHDLQWYIERAQNDTSSPFHEICTNVQQALRRELTKDDELGYGICSMFYCIERYPERCDNCNIAFCLDCNGDASRDEFAIFGVCNSRYCSVCTQLDDVDSAIGCDRWDQYYSSCRCECKYCFACASTAQVDCGECLALHFPTIMARYQAQQTEIAQLRQQINQLQMNDD